MKIQDLIIALADNERAAADLTRAQQRDKQQRQREDIVMTGWLAEWWCKHVVKKKS